MLINCNVVSVLVLVKCMIFLLCFVNIRILQVVGNLLKLCGLNVVWIEAGNWSSVTLVMILVY